MGNHHSPNLSGSYIVELVATDEAGNQGFATRYILTVDLDALCVHLSPLSYQAELKQPGIRCGGISIRFLQ